MAHSGLWKGTPSTRVVPSRQRRWHRLTEKAVRGFRELCARSEEAVSLHGLNESFGTVPSGFRTGTSLVVVASIPQFQSTVSQGPTDNSTRRGVLGDHNEIKFTTYLVIVDIKRTKVVQEEETLNACSLCGVGVGISRDWF